MLVLLFTRLIFGSASRSILPPMRAGAVFSDSNHIVLGLMLIDVDLHPNSAHQVARRAGDFRWN